MTETNGTYSKDEEAGLRVAELVLGLLPADEAERVRTEAESNEALAADISRWEDRLAHIADDLSPVAPPGIVWQAIKTEISASPRRVEANVESAHPARRSLWDNIGFWRGLSFASLGTAAAASIVAAMMFFQTGPVPLDQTRLVAALAVADGEAASFVATYDPQRKQIVIVPASVLNDQQRVPELWLVTQDKRVISLGVIASDDAQAVVIPPELIAETNAGAGLVITLEPPGGAPEGVATGPAIAQGELSPI